MRTILSIMFLCASVLAGCATVTATDSGIKLEDKQRWRVWETVEGKAIKCVEVEMRGVKRCEPNSHHHQYRIFSSRMLREPPVGEGGTNYVQYPQMDALYNNKIKYYHMLLGNTVRYVTILSSNKGGDPIGTCDVKLDKVVGVDYYYEEICKRSNGTLEYRADTVIRAQKGELRKMIQIIFR